MIPHDQPLRKQTIERMLNAFSEEEKYESLTKWEMDFVDSINEQFLKKDDLSNRQCEILERIYDKL